MVITTKIKFPTWLACPLVNGDESGIDERDEPFYQAVLKALTNDRLQCVGVDDDAEFLHSSPREAQDLGVQDLGGDFATFHFQLTPWPGFTDYITCALWSSTDNADESGGEPLDANYSADDIHNDTLYELAAEYHAFLDLINPHEEHEEFPDYEQIGHDFWLTRNGHGAGFWDRGLGELGDQLTEAAKSYGECNLYIGDDGKIHSA